MPDGQLAPVAQPCEKPLDLPAPAVTTEFPAVLERFPFPVVAVRADEFAADMPNELAQPVRAVGLVDDDPAEQPPRLCVHVREGGDHQLHLGGRCGGKDDSQRKTLAVGQL